MLSLPVVLYIWSLYLVFLYCVQSVMKYCFGVQLTWVWILALLLKPIMILGKSLHLSETRFYHLKNWDNTYLIKLLCRWNEIITLHELINVCRLLSIIPGRKQCVCAHYSPFLPIPTALLTQKYIPSLFNYRHVPHYFSGLSSCLVLFFIQLSFELTLMIMYLLQTTIDGFIYFIHFSVNPILSCTFI